MSKFCLLLFSTFLSINICLGNNDRKAFVRKYKDIAIQEMQRTGIPASIKLAQGILESGCGKSELSLKGNNHFGIKCHDWTGDHFYKYDDGERCCFRKYKSAEASWVDHSNFLTSRPRYASLFNLKATDYKGWAHGLKKAGYATDPQYAQRLIKIIEEEELHQYDLSRGSSNGNKKQGKIYPSTTKTNYQARMTYINGVPCITTQPGDSFEAIARYFGIPLKKLLHYNDKKEVSIRPGMHVFLDKKKKKGAKSYSFHRAKEGETLYWVSQLYGIKLSSLLKYNYMECDEKLQPGELISLRAFSKLF